jgi:hypothetical protein
MANTGSVTIASSQYAKAVRGSSGHRPHYARGRPVAKKKEKKKMGFFRRKFNQWVRDAWNEAHDTTEVAVRSSEGVTGKSSIRFTIYAAQGGNIIEYYKQDRYRESDGPELVLVTGDQTIGQAVEHILTMEALKS